MSEPEPNPRSEDSLDVPDGPRDHGPRGADAPRPSDDARTDERRDVPAAPFAPVELTDDPLFEALWGQVLASWEDDKVHASALEYSVNAERLPDLAGRYRALKDDAERGPRAQKRLDAIVVAATQLMMSMKTSAATKVPVSITLSVFGICVCVVAFLAYTILHRQ